MTRKITLALLSLSLLAAACGGGDDPAATTAGGVAVAPRIEQVTATEAEALLAAAPADLVVLDVRTPDEYGGGHIAGAENLDFYATDFESRLAGLDRDVPYFVYCRSGNRSGSTRELMGDLGFTEVYELQGGILSWLEAGLPTE